MASFYLLVIVAVCCSYFGQSFGAHSINDEKRSRGSMASTKALSFWPKGEIPYEIDLSSGFDSVDLERINLAIQDYHAKTCIRWVQRTSQADYALFLRNVSEQGCAYTDRSCYSPGRHMMVYENCRSTETFIHEMGHVLCYGHEQDRADRTKYLNCPGSGGTYSQHLYDYGSVMHYPCPSNEPCTTPSLPGVLYCGQQYEQGRLTVLDAEKLNDMYNCQGCLSYRFRRPNEITPANAFVGGKDLNGNPTYPCRAYVNGHIYVGTAHTSLGGCYVSDKGLEFTITGTDFEVLTNPSSANLQWAKVNGGNIPSNAIAGGRKNDWENVYIGRCNLNAEGRQSVTIGRIMVKSPNTIYVPFGGKEYQCTDFEVLTCQG